MSDYTCDMVYMPVTVLYSLYQRIGVGIVAKDVAVVDAGVVGGEPDAPGLGGMAGGQNGNAVSAGALPSGFRRLGDLRKHAAKRQYDQLAEWIGKTIRLEGLGFNTEKKDDKTIITSGEMTFSEFDPTDPEREVSDDMVTKSAIPRGAIRALYAAVQADPDATIVCDVVKGKRGIALQ